MYWYLLTPLFIFLDCIGNTLSSCYYCPTDMCQIWEFSSKDLSKHHSLVSLTGFDPDSAQKPHWTALWSCLSCQSTQPYFSQPPSPHWLLLCAAPLIHNGMSHALNRPLSWVPFCVCLCQCFISKDHCFIIFCKPTRLMIMVIRVLWRNYSKIPLQERLSPVGILLHGVMHNSGLCGGGQACPGTD